MSEAGFINNNPVISIGGPAINKLTDEFDKWVALSAGAGGKYRIAGPGGRTGFFRKISVGLPQVALWGTTANDTRETVEHYLKDEQGLSSLPQDALAIAFPKRLYSPESPFPSRCRETLYARMWATDGFALVLDFRNAHAHGCRETVSDSE